MMQRSLVRGLALGVVALMMVAGAMAQTTGKYPRWKVMEEFTSATCPPCAAATPEVNHVADLQKRQLVIKIHTPIPIAGDPWYEMNTAQVRDRMNYYQINSAPSSVMGGTTKQNPHPSAGGRTALQNAFDQIPPTSFMQVSVAQDGGDIDVTVKTDRAFSNATLQVMTMTDHVDWPSLGQEISNHNGETSFSYIYMFSYPDANGTPVSMGANETRTWSFNPALGDGKPWDGNQYVIAFVQDNNTGEILQAGFTGSDNTPAAFEWVKGTDVVANLSGIYERVDRAGTNSKDITLTNTGSESATVTLAINNADDLTQAGMSAKLTPSEVTIAAGETATVKLEVTGPANNSVFTQVVPSMSASDGLGRSVPSVFYLVNGARVVNYYGMGDGNISALTALTGLRSTYGADVVYMPYSTDILTNYPMTEFDAAVISFGPYWLNMRFTISDIERMLRAGKGVWIAGQANMYAAFDRYGTNSAFTTSRDFYRNVLGIELNTFEFRITTNSNGQITGINTFPVNGVNGDPIGDGISFTANQYSQSYPFYTQGTDIIRLTNGSRATPAFYYDGVQSRIGVVRVQPEMGGKIVYGSLGMEMIANEANRNQVGQKVLDWLLGSGEAPEIAVSREMIDYGNVAVGSTKDNSFTISNSGSADLEISAVNLAGVDAASFAITQGKPGFGETITLAPGETHNVTVQFAPTADQTSFAAAVEIASNAGGKSVSLRAGATVGVETDVVSETGAISMRLSGQNPIIEQSSIELTATMPVTVTMMDASGRTVATLFNGATAGTELIELNAAKLTSGTYNVVATTGTETAVLTVVVVR